MEDANALKERIKKMMVDNLMLQVSAEEIGDDLPLFGPGSLGLDSALDAMFRPRGEGRRVRSTPVAPTRGRAPDQRWREPRRLRSRQFPSARVRLTYAP
jgi:hypothetical protein